MVSPYRRIGSSGLVDQRTGGNRAQLSSAQKEALKQVLHDYRPQQWFSPEADAGECWDMALLAKVGKASWGFYRIGEKNNAKENASCAYA